VSDQTNHYHLWDETDQCSGRSEHVPTERRKIPPRMRLFQPLKRTWRKATSKGRNEQPSTNPVGQHEHDPNSYMLSSSSLTGSPSLIVVVPTEAPASRLAPCELSLVRSVSSRMTLVEPVSSPKAMSPTSKRIAHRVYHWVPIKRTSQIRFEASKNAKSLPLLRMSQALIVDEVGLVKNPNETNNKRNGVYLLEGRSDTEGEVNMGADDGYSTAGASPSTEAPSKPAASPSISSDEANYQRLIKVFFRKPASRIPIPVAWRNVALRAYSFRGPASPFQEVATAPVPAATRDSMYASLVHAIESRKGSASHTTRLTSEITATTHHAVTNELNYCLSGDGNTSSSALPRPSTPVPKHELSNTETLPSGWYPILPSRERDFPTTRSGPVRPATAMSGGTVWYDAMDE
jgi:hypothetical protein